MGPDNVTTTQKYDGIIVQSSLLGVSIPKMWGTNKVGCNLMDYLDFSSQKVSSGKGGANPQYTYKATLILGIVQGPIAGIRTIYKDQAIFTATASGSKEVDGTTITISSKTPDQAAGLNGGIFTGEIGQTPWTYLDTDSPAHAIGYSGIAYAAAYHYPLDTSATPPNHNFEVQATIRAVIGGVQNDDANPADIVNDMLPDVPRWPANAISDLTTYSTYCLAQGLLLSPIADNGRQASDLLTEILTCSNSDAVWSDGQLKIVPYGDTAITNNGAAFTPNLTPVYALTWDDIIPNSAGEDPIQWDLTRTLEAYNYVQVNFLDRTLQYATNTATAVDQANINAFGRRQQSPQEFDSVCLMATASTIAQLMVQRSANVRRTAQFTVSELFGLLDPMDLITVPLRDGGVRLVRIVEANEQADGSIQLQVEEMLVGAAHAAEYTRQDGLGIASDFNVDPGDTNPPAIINPPQSLTNGANEVWITASGGPQWGGCVVWASFDGDTYQSVGVISQPGRYGVTTSDFPAGTDPDTTDTLGVSLVQSLGALTAGTQADADGQATLCAVGTEIIAYSAATLTGANTYNLGTYIRRGLEGTTIADQPAGSLFMRLDGSQVAIPYNAGQVGKTLYVKLQSFNLYGGAYEDLDLCEAYEFTAEPNGTNVEDVTWTAISGIPTLLTSYVASGGTAVATSSVPATATFGDGETAASAALAAIDAATANVTALQSQITAANTSISALTATYGDTASAAASAAAASGYSYAASVAATNAATYESGALSYQTGAADYATDAGNYVTDAYDQFIAAQNQAGDASNSAGEASGYAVAAGSSAAAAQNSASLSANVSAAYLNANPNFNAFPTSPGIPTSWSDWTSGTGTLTGGLTPGSNAYTVATTGTEQSGIVQSFYLTGGYYVLEIDAWLQAGTWETAGILVQDQATTDIVTLHTSADADINGTTTAGVPGIRSFRKLIQWPTSGDVNFYLFTEWGGFDGNNIAKTMSWYHVAIRAASTAEVQGGEAYITANATESSFNSFVTAQDGTNTSLAEQVDDLNAAVFDAEGGTLQAQIAANQAAQATQNEAFSTSITTVQAQLQTGVNLVQNPDFQLGLTVGWTCIAGAGLFNFGPYQALIWNPGAAGTQGYGGQVAATSSPFAVNPGAAIAVQALFYSGGIGASSTFQRLIVQWLNSSLEVITAPVAIQVDVTQGWSYQKADITTGTLLAAPSDAAYAQVVCDIASSSGDVITSGDNLCWGQIQVEQGDCCTPYKNSLLTASVTQNSAAIVDNTNTISGLQSTVYGSYTLQVDAGDAITGLELLSESGKTSLSDVIFTAENFLIVSSAGGGSVVPFAYSSDTGTLVVQNVDIAGDLVVEGSITAAQIADATITSTQVAPNAITQAAETEDDTEVELSTTPMQIGEITVTTTGKPLSIWIDVGCLNTSTNHDQNVQFTTYDGTSTSGTLINTFNGRVGQNSASISGGAEEDKVTFFRYTGAAAGSHTFTVYGQFTGGTAGSLYKLFCRIMVTEYKDQSS